MKKILLISIFILLLSGCGKTFYCEEGLLIDEVCIVTKSTEPTYSCDEGYTLDAETNTCTNKRVVAIDTVAVCEEGYYATDDSCQSYETFRKISQKGCLTGLYRVLDYIESQNVVLQQSSYYDFQSSYNADTDQCTYTLFNQAGNEEVTVASSNISVCPPDTIEIGGICKKEMPKEEKQECSEGTQTAEGECEIIDNTDVIITCPASYSYNAENKMCEKTAEEPALKK